MSDWKEDILQNVAKIQQGYAFKSEDFNNTTGIPVIKIKNIASGVVDISETQYYSKDNSGLQKYLVKKGDILIAMTGSHLDQPSSVVGRVSKYKDEQVSLLNQRTAKFEPLNEVINSNFLYYSLILDETLLILAGNASGSANQANISSTQIYNLPILLPPLLEQESIAEVLSSLDDKIDLLRRNNKTLEQLAETLFRQWFVEEIDGILDGKLGDIIELYDNKRVPLSSTQRDKRKTGELFPYYGAATIMDYINSYIFDDDYLLLGEDGTVQDDDGFPILQRAIGKCWINNHTHVIKAKKPYSNNYLEILLKRTNIAHLVTGAVQPKINQGNLKELIIPIPTSKKVVLFSSIVDPLFNKKHQNIFQIAKLEVVRDTLLPKLMSGAVRVTN